MYAIIINAVAIIIGSSIGALFQRGISEKYVNVLNTAMGLCAITLGMNVSMESMQKTEYPVLFIFCLSIGGLVGTLLKMDQRDFDTYMELFESMMEVVEMPELMIYLRSSVPHLVKNIQKRGRDYEQKMPIDYLEGINLLYDDFIMNKYKGRVLVVEVDNLDFEHNPKQFGDIIDKIDAKLFGFFS